MAAGQHRFGQGVIMGDQINQSFTPEPSPELEAAVLNARIIGALAREVDARRPHWIGGVPTEMDTHAICKSVARRLAIDVEQVETVFADVEFRRK